MNMREEFEKWMSKCFDVRRAENGNGVYRSRDVRLAWMGWNAAQPKWINCSDHMPPVNTWVLVVTDTGRFYTAYFNELLNSWDDGSFYSDIKGVVGWCNITTPFGIQPPNPPEE